MAKIEHTELFRFENFDPSIVGKKVGNNRTVSHVLSANREGGEDRTIIGSLHGHPVFTLYKKEGGYTLRLDTCGYTTVTTRAAMADFTRAAGLRIGVSIAGGELSAALFHPVGGQELLPSGGSIIRYDMSAEEWAHFTDLRELT